MQEDFIIIIIVIINNNNNNILIIIILKSLKELYSPLRIRFGLHTIQTVDLIWTRAKNKEVLPQKILE